LRIAAILASVGSPNARTTLADTAGEANSDPTAERMHVLGEILSHIAERLTFLGLYYVPLPGASANRLLNVSSDWPTQFINWNAHEWEVRG
jgi:hypothetical protein